MEVQPDANIGESASASVHAAEARAYLERLLASPSFAASPRRAQLLRYLAMRALAGEGESINEYAIGVDVFGKPPSFDPRLESVVRTEFSRLRQKLKEYYAGEGRADPIWIDFPQRSYVAALTHQTHAESLPPTPAAPMPAVRRRWPWALAAALAIVAAVATWDLKRIPEYHSNSLVVLPFQNLSADRNDDYLADGLTEDLTNHLAQAKDLRVVARTTAYLFKGKAIDIRDLGRRLNVETVIEGSFARQGDLIHITAQMNRTSDGYHVWSHSYEAPARNIIATQEEIARSIVSELRRSGQKPVVPLTSDSTKDPEAHDLYLRANHERFLNTPGSYLRSLALFQAAVERDPRYVNAYVGIGRSYVSLMHLSEQPPQMAVPAAKAALGKALELNPSAGEVRGLLADLIETYDWDWARAQREFERAIADGGQAPTHSLYGSLLATRGNFREAQAELRLAQDLDPLGVGPRFNQFVAFSLERNYPEAKSVLNGMLSMNPDMLDARYSLGAMAFMEHDCARARSEYEWAARKFPAPFTTIGLALACACEGRRDQARQLLAEAAKPAKAGYTSPYGLALGYAAVGDNETALSLLEQSAGAKEMQILYLKYEPIFDGIRADRRYIALEQRVGLLP